MRLTIAVPSGRGVSAPVPAIASAVVGYDEQSADVRRGDVVQVGIQRLVDLTETLAEPLEDQRTRGLLIARLERADGDAHGVSAGSSRRTMYVRSSQQSPSTLARRVARERRCTPDRPPSGSSAKNDGSAESAGAILTPAFHAPQRLRNTRARSSAVTCMRPSARGRAEVRQPARRALVHAGRGREDRRVDRRSAEPPAARRTRRAGHWLKTGAGAIEHDVHVLDDRDVLVRDEREIRVPAAEERAAVTDDVRPNRGVRANERPQLTSRVVRCVCGAIIAVERLRPHDAVASPQQC